MSEFLSPAAVVETLGKAGVQISERELRAKARRIGCYREVGRAIFSSAARNASRSLSRSKITTPRLSISAAISSTVACRDIVTTLISHSAPVGPSNPPGRSSTR